MLRACPPARRPDARREADGRTMADPAPNRRLATILFADIDGLQPHDARRRGTDAPRSAGAPRRARRAGGRAVSRSHREDRRRRRAGWEFASGREGCALRSSLQRGMSGAQCRRAGRPAPVLPHRPEPGRRHRRTRTCSATPERGGAPAQPRRTGLHRAVRQRLRTGTRQARLAVPLPGFACAEEYRSSGADLFSRRRALSETAPAVSPSSSRAFCSRCSPCSSRQWRSAARSPISPAAIRQPTKPTLPVAA